MLLNGTALLAGIGDQKKVTTQLRHEFSSFGDINSDVLQRNIAKLDAASTNFWQHGSCFPRYLRAVKSFEYKPKQVKIEAISDSYAIIHLPGIGNVKMHNSRDLKLVKEVRNCTVKAF
ncbi:hypothetical protein [Microseira sp. BLCC-F43]|uniref:hypothetical protein n=1 Tax=Microseira sp. BLCC-F43 TaxID=3153602 RepID=UPI0035BAFE33